MVHPLMPKATAVWLVENTALTFEQIANFCGLHNLEVRAIADDEVALGDGQRVVARTATPAWEDPVPQNRLPPSMILILGFVLRPSREQKRCHGVLHLSDGDRELGFWGPASPHNVRALGVLRATQSVATTKQTKKLRGRGAHERIDGPGCPSARMKQVARRRHSMTCSHGRQGHLMPPPPPPPPPFLLRGR